MVWYVNGMRSNCPTICTFFFFCFVFCFLFLMLCRFECWNWYFGEGTCGFHSGRRVNISICLDAVMLAMKMEAPGSSKTFVSTYKAIQWKPEVCHLYSSSCESMKTVISLVTWGTNERWNWCLIYVVCLLHIYVLFNICGMFVTYICIV
jgi:hypothetical protein